MRKWLVPYHEIVFHRFRINPPKLATFRSLINMVVPRILMCLLVHRYTLNHNMFFNIFRNAIEYIFSDYWHMLMGCYGIQPVLVSYLGQCNL